MASTTSGSDATTMPAVPLWDLPTRVFHWALVGLVAFSWWSGENHDMDRHRLSGYTILALLVFRVFWGLFGSRTARFSQFLKGPGAVLAYARGLTGRRHAPAFGHNPMGGWSVAALLLALFAMVGAGLFAVDVDGLESGPLSDYVSFEAGRQAAEIHEAAFNVLLALVALHVLAILYYRFVLGTNLLTAMITGKTRPAAGAQVEPVRASPVALVVGIALAGAVAWAISTGLRF
ncbi:cytochrome b/b6 domain-containing protein [Novosphingobium huizhouense]|uniref:cytochrome b/b6 domain-containing protein n=1 Tax=Novosphingobium huizhouense TaxID=2866625 RepID=UPI001CD8363A|nr:cytochrome b/b6 domain-containing protein [Novosphingobium huizhouense]